VGRFYKTKFCLCIISPQGAGATICQNERLALYRTWLLQFFSALEGENREAILRDLQSVRADYQAVAGKKE